MPQEPAKQDGAIALCSAYEKTDLADDGQARTAELFPGAEAGCALYCEIPAS